MVILQELEKNSHRAVFHSSKLTLKEKFYKALKSLLREDGQQKRLCCRTLTYKLLSCNNLAAKGYFLGIWQMIHLETICPQLVLYRKCV